MNLAVIPARGGSKRIPRKNILPFNGKPMIAWTIEAALASQCFDRVVVSTEDAEIAEIALKHGAEVPFIRPLVLADDFSTTQQVVQHALGELSNGLDSFSAICCLYATAPFLSSDDIRLGAEVIAEGRCDFALAVTSYAFPVLRALKVTPDRQLAMLFPEYASTRSQDLQEAFHDAGQFCWGTAKAWSARGAVFEHVVAPVVLSRERVQDIDTLEDWKRAEWLFKAMKLEESVGQR